MEQTAVGQKEKTGINKTAIRNFAIYSRNKLMNDIKNKAALIGITESGIQKPLSTSTGNVQFFDIGMTNPYQIEGKAINQRNELIRELDRRTQGSTYKTAYETLIEEVAYTWFNRIVAIRFMEVNNYMPNRLRVLSSGVSGINEPELIAHVFESGLEFTEKEQEWIIEQKSNGSNIAMDALFQFLFIKQCNALNANLPDLFEKTNDYSELLLTVSYNDVEGVIYKLIHEVSEFDFDVNSENGNGQVEIIGWLYQFYNTEPKAAVFGRLKSKKIEKQDIPAATQLFTPEWIVRYMVENTLGRLWIEKLHASGDSRSEEKIADDFGWKYYLPEAEQTLHVQQQLAKIRDKKKNLSVEDIKFLDPAMGSFHIGIYAFEVFMQIYTSEGYTTREAAKLIIEKNLHGLDIDKRAAQLSYFTIMMQLRKYNRKGLNGMITPNVYEIPESHYINRSHIDYLGYDIKDKGIWNELKKQLISLLNSFNEAKEYGSLMNISDEYDFKQLKEFVNSNSIDIQVSLFETVGLELTQEYLLKIINSAEIISRKYEIVITNPPYLGSSGMDAKLSKFAKKYYSDSKSDMFAMFIERCKKYTSDNGFFSMITQHAWMFLSSYEKLRSQLMKKTLVNMAHLGARAFEEISGEVVQTTSFVFSNIKASHYEARYLDLTKLENQSKKEIMFLNSVINENEKCNYVIEQEDFEKIPSKIFAYWASKNIIECFSLPSLESYGNPKQGMIPGNTNEFLRLWFEVSKDRIGFSHSSYEDIGLYKKKWFPYAKGGPFRKWYGNNEYVINMENNGYDIKFSGKNNNYRLRDPDLYFKEAITWSKIGSGRFSMRYLPEGSLFDIAGCCIFHLNDNLMYILGFVNSIVAETFLSFMSPTLNFEVEHIKKLPVMIDIEHKKLIEDKVKTNIKYSNDDWNQYETSMDFKTSPLLKYQEQLLSDSYEKYKLETNRTFDKMKTNEEYINQVFIKIYALESEIPYKVNDKNISITKIVDKKALEDNKNSYIIDRSEVVKNFISYIIGCIFGRYSLNREGLMNTDEAIQLSNYGDIQQVKNNVLLICDEFQSLEDITEKFIECIEVIFGKKFLEDNLTFITSALDNKGSSSRDKLKKYFSDDFYKDHLRMYQNRPIYWLYDSGKQNGFKALIYMHQYDEDTAGKVRVEYLHQVQRAYERTIANLQEDITHINNAKEITQIQKSIEKLTKQLKECTEYDERLGHMALERVAIDLDDGVKMNYEKVQTDRKGKFHQILAKI